jgi:hypothetical protein
LSKNQDDFGALGAISVIVECWATNDEIWFSLDDFPKKSVIGSDLYFGESQNATARIFLCDADRNFW